MQLPAVAAPPLFQLGRWITDPLGYMEASARHCGDLFLGQVGANFRSLVFASHPEALQQILTHDTQEFRAPGEFNKILQPLVGAHSVIMAEGDRHRRQRQLLLPPFHGERMRAYGQTICEITRRAASQIPPGKPFSARSLMQDISLQVILSAVFGLETEAGERHQTLKPLLGALTDIFASPFNASFLLVPTLQKDWGAWSPWGRFLRLQQQIDALLYQEIQERREHFDPERTDILTLLLSARDEAGEPMTDQELHDELLTLLFAGHETTESQGW